MTSPASSRTILVFDVDGTLTAARQVSLRDFCDTVPGSRHDNAPLKSMSCRDQAPFLGGKILLLHLNLKNPNIFRLLRLKCENS